MNHRGSHRRRVAANISTQFHVERAELVSWGADQDGLVLGALLEQQGVGLTDCELDIIPCEE